MRLGLNQPFAPAAALLTHFTGVAMSAATLRRLTETAGATVHQITRIEAAAAHDTLAPPHDAPAVPLQVSVDGSLIHVRDEGWREVKLAAIGERTDAALTALSYAATLGDATTLGREALGELVRRGVPWAGDVVAVHDGAEWIQGFLDEQCPQAHRVLDFAHAAGYLAQAATAAYGEGTAAAQGWFGGQRHALRHDEPAAVLTALGALPTSAPRDLALGYLTARRAQIAYRDFCARGWPLGSGCVESAHKAIVPARLKGPGMRWSRGGAEALLALRVAQANDRWAEMGGHVGEHQRAAQRARTTTRRAARHRPPPRPKLVVDGTPTADHPWRRFRLPGSRPPHHRI